MQNETNPLYPKDPIHDSSVIKIPLSYILFMYDWRGKGGWYLAVKFIIVLCVARMTVGMPQINESIKIYPVAYLLTRSSYYFKQIS